MTSLTCEQATDLAGGYVLGALEAANMALVREHLATCPNRHPEFAELGGVVPHLAEALEPIEPAPEVRTRIVEAARAERRAEAGSGAAPRRPVPAGPLASASRPWWRSRGGLAWAAAAVAIAILAGSTVYLSGQLADSRAYADQLARAVALAGAPGSRAVILAPTPGGGAPAPIGPAGLAALPERGSGVLVAHGLAPTRGSEVYEVWLIQGSAAPTPAGSFSVGADGRGWLDTVAVAGAGPVTVALTKEPGPGATTPTLPIVAAGASG